MLSQAHPPSCFSPVDPVPTHLLWLALFATAEDVHARPLMQLMMHEHAKAVKFILGSLEPGEQSRNQTAVLVVKWVCILIGRPPKKGFGLSVYSSLFFVVQGVELGGLPILLHTQVSQPLALRRSFRKHREGHGSKGFLWRKRASKESTFTLKISLRGRGRLARTY